EGAAALLDAAPEPLERFRVEGTGIAEGRRLPRQDLQLAEVMGGQAARVQAALLAASLFRPDDVPAPDTILHRPFRWSPLRAVPSEGPEKPADGDPDPVADDRDQGEDDHHAKEDFHARALGERRVSAPSSYSLSRPAGRPGPPLL